MSTRSRNAAQKPEDILARFFQRNGYFRVPNWERKELLGPKYRKGYEVRIVVDNEAELAEVRRALRKQGFTLAKPFKKGKKIVQPVYGKEAFLFFSQFVKDND